MKRPLPSPPASAAAEAPRPASAERTVWPTTRRRFLALVLAAGGVTATARVARHSAASPVTGKRPRWIGHC